VPDRVQVRAGLDADPALLAQRFADRLAGCEPVQPVDGVPVPVITASASSR